MLTIPDFGEHSLLVTILIVCAVVAIIIILFPKPHLTEGFQQNERFLMGQPYDEFYANHYDIIHDTETRTNIEFQMLLPHLAADDDDDDLHVLDVGCGTGQMLRLLSDAGVPSAGIDKSAEMTKHCSTLNVVTGDALNPMHFDAGSFTHVLCLHHTIYEVEDPAKLLAVCKGWLRAGGILVVHVVDKERFNMVAPCGATPFITNPQDHVKQRIRKSKVNFIDYLYESDYATGDKQVVETFTDGASGNTRQYEKPIDLDVNVPALAAKNGFKFLEKKPLPSDQNQWLYFYRVI